MNDMCNSCYMCCKIIPLKSDEEIIVRDGLQPVSASFKTLLQPLTIEDARNINELYVNKVQESFGDVKFYTCKALSADNKCTLDKKPDECKNFPNTSLAIVPDECVYLGKVFIENEKLKQKIRHMKEEILDYECRIKCGDINSDSYKKIILNLKKFIDKYSLFGSENW